MVDKKDFAAPVKPERPKVSYILDEKELSDAEVEAWKTLNPPKSQPVIQRDSDNKPIKPQRPPVTYR